MKTETLTQKINDLSSEVDSDVKTELPNIIISSGLLEQCVDLVIAGESTQETMAAFFQRLEEEYLDEYETVGNMAELLALTKINDFGKSQ